MSKQCGALSLLMGPAGHWSCPTRQQAGLGQGLWAQGLLEPRSRVVGWAGLGGRELWWTLLPVDQPVVDLAPCGPAMEATRNLRSLKGPGAGLDLVLGASLGPAAPDGSVLSLWEGRTEVGQVLFCPARLASLTGVAVQVANNLGRARRVGSMRPGRAGLLAGETTSSTS